MKAYWWRKHPNWGDALTPLILGTLLGRDRDTAVWSQPEEAEIVMVGSVLEHLPPGYDGIVAGAGKLFEASKISLHAANVLALRGELSAKGVPGDYVLGDPGFLAPYIRGRGRGKFDTNIKLLVVPHWSDTDLTIRFDRGVAVAASYDPETVIGAISRAKKVVSSSLHGCIVAASFGVPFQAELPPTAASVGVGDGFKFRDVFGKDFQFGVMQEADATKVEKTQAGLREMVERIHEYMERTGQ